MDRRSFVAALATILAGCSQSGGGDTSTPPVVTETALRTRPETDTPTPSTPMPDPTRTASYFESTLKSELFAKDVYTQSITTRGNEAVLGHGIERKSTAAVGEAMGIVARVFADVVADEWDIDRLMAKAILGREELASYHIRTDWAMQFRSGTMSSDEYSDRVIDTLELSSELTGPPIPTRNPESTVTQVDVTGRDAHPSDAEPRLDVGFTAVTASFINPNPQTASLYTAPPDQKFVVVQVRITNESDRPFQVAASLFDLHIDGTAYDRISLEETPNPVHGVTLASGEQTEGWIPYLVPSDATEATLAIDQSIFPTLIEVDFHPDTTLTVTIA